MLVFLPRDNVSLFCSFSYWSNPIYLSVDRLGNIFFVWPLVAFVLLVRYAYHSLRFLCLSRSRLLLEGFPAREPFSVGLGCASVLRNVDSVITFGLGSLSSLLLLFAAK
jgi:hypothetical protein